jgi:hypothetical protein
MRTKISDLLYTAKAIVNGWFEPKPQPWIVCTEMVTEPRRIVDLSNGKLIVNGVEVVLPGHKFVLEVDGDCVIVKPRRIKK